jgi:hypothetical protein
MKVSIMSDWNICYGIDYSKFWAEVIDISDDDFGKIQSRTHTLEKDNDVRWLLELPPVEPTEAELEAIALAEAKALEEKEIQEAQELILRKQALELLWKDTSAVQAQLEAKAPQQ